MRTPSPLFSIFCVAAMFALVGCSSRTSNPTNISYREVGICQSYETPDGVIAAGKNKGFAVFEIKSADNTKYDEDFVLAPARLFVNQFVSSQAGTSKWYRRFGRVDPRFAQAMKVSSVSETKVSAKANLDINTFFIISVDSDASGQDKDNPLNFQLAYDTGDTEAAYDAATGARGSQSQAGVNEGIVLTKINPNDGKFTIVEDCKELSFH